MKGEGQLTPEAVKLAWDAAYKSNELYDQMVELHGPSDEEADQNGSKVGKVALTALEAGYGQLGDLGKEFESYVNLANIYARMYEGDNPFVLRPRLEQKVGPEAVLWPQSRRRAGTLLHFLADNDGAITSYRGHGVSTVVRKETGISGSQWYTLLSRLSEMEVLTVKKQNSLVSQVVSGVSIELNNLQVIEELIDRGELPKSLRQPLAALRRRREAEDTEDTLTGDKTQRIEAARQVLGQRFTSKLHETRS